METSQTAPDLTLPSLTLLYHEILSRKSSYSYALEAEEFDQQVALFARIRSRLRQLPQSCLWPEISFDDGHLSDYEHALPILAAHGMLARFFITVGWTGARAGYMAWPQLQSLHRAGHHIGAHGFTHTLLTHCTPAQLSHELVSSRQALEDQLGCAITTMSLPGGRYNRRVLSACQAAGYTRIFTSVPRAQAVPHGLLTGRLNIRARMTLPLIEQLLQPSSPALARLERQHHLKQAAKTFLGDHLYARLWALANKQEPGDEPGPHTAP